MFSILVRRDNGFYFGADRLGSDVESSGLRHRERLSPRILYFMGTRRAKIEVMGYECVSQDCGKRFPARRPDARFCSSACRQHAHRERKAKPRKTP